MELALRSFSFLQTLLNNPYFFQKESELLLLMYFQYTSNFNNKLHQTQETGTSEA
jgi:hypothetical protein